MTSLTGDTIAHSAPRMPRRGPGATAALATAALGALLLTAACAGQAASTPTRAATSAMGVTAAAATPTIAPIAATSRASAPTSSPEAGVTVSSKPELSIEPDTGQTRVRFTVGDAEIVVRIADNPTSRDFMSMLPLTLDFRDFNAMEKVGDLPRRLTTEGSTGGAPANGDLIYFVPWGNLGFFYDAARRDASFDDRVIPIGTVESGYDRLNDLQSGPVLVELLP